MLMITCNNVNKTCLILNKYSKTFFAHILITYEITFLLLLFAFILDAFTCGQPCQRVFQ